MDDEQVEYHGPYSTAQEAMDDSDAGMALSVPHGDWLARYDRYGNVVYRHLPPMSGRLGSVGRGTDSFTCTCNLWRPI